MIINNEEILNELSEQIKTHVTQEDIDKINSVINDYVQNMERADN